MVLLLKYGGKEKKQVEHNTVGKKWENVTNNEICVCLQIVLHDY